MYMYVCMYVCMYVKLHFTEFALTFKLRFFADNFREFATLNVVYKEIFKLHIFIEIRQEYF